MAAPPLETEPIGMTASAPNISSLTGWSERRLIKRMFDFKRLSWVLLICPGLVGASVMVMSGATVSRWGVHLLALLLGSALYLLLVRGRARAISFGALVPSLSVASLAFTLAGNGLSGVHRWVAVGPLLVNTSALLVPIVLVYCVLLGEKRPIASISMVVASQAVHLFQPDAGQATAFGLAAVFVPVGRSKACTFGLRVMLIASIVSVWSMSDPLAPTPFVEDILSRAFSVGHGLGLLASIGLTVYASSPLWLSSEVASYRLRLMLTTYLSLTVLVTFIGAFPVPLVGYSPSPVLGTFLGLAMLIRAERWLAGLCSQDVVHESQGDTREPPYTCRISAASA